MSVSRLSAGFTFAAAVALFVFSVILFRAQLVAGPVLKGADAVFPFSTRTVLYLLAGGGVALSAYLLIVGPNHTPLKLYLLAWFCSSVCLYQIGASWCGRPNFLGCLGNLDSRIPLPPDLLTPLMLAFFAVVFLTDLLLLALHHLERRKSKTARRAAFADSQTALTFMGRP